MRFAEFVHCSVDHADLRCIAVCDHQLIAFFHHISQHSCGCFDSLFLLRKCGAEGTVSESDYDSFLHAKLPRFSLDFNSRLSGIILSGYSEKINKKYEETA